MQTSHTFEGPKLSTDLLLSSTSSSFPSEMRNSCGSENSNQNSVTNHVEDINDCLSYSALSQYKSTTTPITLMSHQETPRPETISIKRSEFDKSPFYCNKDTIYKTNTSLISEENYKSMLEPSDVSSKKKNKTYIDNSTEILDNENYYLQKVITTLI